MAWGVEVVVAVVPQEAGNYENPKLSNMSQRILESLQCQAQSHPD